MRDDPDKVSPAPSRVNIRRRAPDRASLAADERGGEELAPHGEYPLPEELARHLQGERFSPDELRRACREAGEGLGREDAREATFRAAAEMVKMWGGWISRPGKPPTSCATLTSVT